MQRRYSIGFVQLALLNPPIGAARYARKIINILSNIVDITVYSFDGEARNELEDVKIVSVFNAKKYKFLPLRLLMYIYAILKLMFSIQRHDVLISFGDIENFMIFFHKFFINPKVKTILEIHHVPGGLTFREQIKNKNLPFGFLTLLGNFLVKKFDAIVTVSEFWQNRIHQYFKIPMKKIYVAYTGIEDICQRKKKYFRIKFKHPILYAGIADPLQNIELVITSLPLIKQVFPDANLILTGRYKKNYFNKLMTLAKSLNVESSFHHLGILSEENLPYVYKQSDIIISVPGDYVGWSAILLKGILYKKPCIALNKGALKEFVQRYDGICVSNNPEDFSKTVIKLLKNKQLRKKIIETAYERAKKDTWKKTAMVHLKCIKDIMHF